MGKEVFSDPFKGEFDPNLKGEVEDYVETVFTAVMSPDRYSAIRILENRGYRILDYFSGIEGSLARYRELLSGIGTNIFDNISMERFISIKSLLDSNPKLELYLKFENLTDFLFSHSDRKEDIPLDCLDFIKNRMRSGLFSISVLDPTYFEYHKGKGKSVDTDEGGKDVKDSTKRYFSSGLNIFVSLDITREERAEVVEQEKMRIMQKAMEGILERFSPSRVVDLYLRMKSENPKDFYLDVCLSNYLNSMTKKDVLRFLMSDNDILGLIDFENLYRDFMALRNPKSIYSIDPKSEYYNRIQVLISRAKRTVRKTKDFLYRHYYSSLLVESEFNRFSEKTASIYEQYFEFLRVKLEKCGLEDRNISKFAGLLVKIKKENYGVFLHIRDHLQTSFISLFENPHKKGEIKKYKYLSLILPIIPK
jgi:hypothetical protein